MAKIIMIPKKESNSKDPKKYRPISLNSCLGKLVKLLIKTIKGRLTICYFLHNKISEALNKGKTVLGIIFEEFSSYNKNFLSVKIFTDI